MASSSRRPGTLGERGAITWVTALIIALLVAVGYLGVVWVPVWFVHYAATQVVRDYGNQAVKNPDDARLLDSMCHKLQAIDTIRVPGPDGRLEARPTVDVSPQEVTWERDTSAVPPTLHVAFDYHRDIYYPVLDRWTERTMRVDITMDIARADWGPAR
jgi:hypothetical protein